MYHFEILYGRPGTTAHWVDSQALQCCQTCTGPIQVQSQVNQSKQAHLC